MEEFQRSGSMAAFEEVFRRNKEPLYGFLMRLSGQEAIAQDLSQQAWLKVLQLVREGRYQSVAGAAFRTFLFTLARNRYFDEYRRRHEAVRAVSLDDFVERGGEIEADEQLEPSRIVGDAQLQSKLHRVIEALPLEQREVIVLWLEGFALTEVAQITGAGWHTVVSRKSYALKKLKLALSASRVEG